MRRARPGARHSCPDPRPGRPDSETPTRTRAPEDPAAARAPPFASIRCAARRRGRTRSSDARFPRPAQTAVDGSARTWLSVEALAAVHAQCLARDPAGTRRCQKQRDLRHFFRRPVAAERNAVPHRGVTRRILLPDPIPYAAREFNRARRDGVDADAVLGKFERLRSGVVADRSFHRRVRRPAAARMKRRDRAGVQDAALWRLPEVRQRRARGAHGGHQVDIEIGEPGFVIFAEAITRSVVDQHIDAAKRRSGGFNVGADRLRIAEIAALCMGDRTECSHCIARFFQRSRTTRADGHRGARTRERQRHGAPDAATAAGDDHAVAGEVEWHRRAHRSNLIPCASGNESDQLIVLVCRRMYTFHASEPDSRPPPVSFSPPNAPPISAPEVPMLTLAMPQSEPAAERKRSDDFTLLVKMDDDRPCGTAFCVAIASSSELNGITYRIGAKVSVCTTGLSLRRPLMIVGCTKLPLPSSVAPPASTLPPEAFAFSIASLKRFTEAASISGPINVSDFVGSPIFFATCA